MEELTCGELYLVVNRASWKSQLSQVVIHNEKDLWLAPREGYIVFCQSTEDLRYYNT